MTAVFTDLLPLVSQKAAWQPDAMGTVTATSGSSTPFANLLGLTLTATETVPAESANPFPCVMTGALNGDSAGNVLAEEPEDPSLPEIGALAVPDGTPAAVPLVADHIIHEFLRPLLQTANQHTEAMNPGSVCLRPALRFSAQSTDLSAWIVGSRVVASEPTDHPAGVVRSDAAHGNHEQPSSAPVMPLTNLAEPIEQLAAQQAPTDGFAPEVMRGELLTGSPLLVSAALAEQPNEWVAPSNLPQLTPAQTSVIESIPGVGIDLEITAKENSPVPPAAAPQGSPEDAPPPETSGEKQEGAGQDGRSPRLAVRVRVDATPERVRATEHRLQAQRGNTWRHGTATEPAPPLRNPLPSPPETAPAPVTPVFARIREQVQMPVRSGPVPALPVRSQVAVSAQVRHNPSEQPVLPGDHQRSTTVTPESLPAARLYIRPDPAAMTNVRVAEQATAYTPPRSERMAPPVTAGTVNTSVPLEATLGMDTPEAARFVIKTPEPLPVPGRITVHLEPPELGAIRIDLSVGARGVVGRMRFDAEPVRAVVERDFPRLHKTLADAGVRVERFEIAGHTAGRETAAVWVADDTGQNPLSDRAPHGRAGTGAPSDPRERLTRDDDRRRSPGTPTAFTHAGGLHSLRAGQVNLLA